MLQCSIYLESFGPVHAFISETAIKIGREEGVVRLQQFSEPKPNVEEEKEIRVDAGTKT